MTDQPRPDVLRHTADVVSAHLGHNKVAAEPLPALIQSVYQALSSLGQEPAPSTARPEPAMPIRRSVFPDYIVCLEDGAKLKMLKRYLLKRYDMTPAAYRERWGLPADYPMVAPNYAQTRSAMARQIGLGRKKAIEEPTDAQDAGDAIVEPQAEMQEVETQAAESTLEPTATKAPRKSTKPRAPRRKAVDAETGE